jgi:tetratricopeptide (TPR) repeat protein
MSRSRPTSGAPIRRWHLPPPLVHGPEALEGGAVLEEVPGAAGLVLWQALRDVLLWAATQPERRSLLFGADAAARRRETVAGLSWGDAPVPAIEALTPLLADAAGADPVRIAAACAGISEWAERKELPRTAFAFAQNAALATPAEPAPALEAARLALRLDDAARAELWYRRAIGTARRARNWRLYSRAFSRLATLYRSRGNLPAAQRFHLRALRGARRGGLRLERAVALHDLFALAVEAGRSREAERLAAQALEAYPAGHPRLPVLAHDVGYFWMEQGRFARALRVFDTLETLIDRPLERLWLDADRSRAAAGAGDAAGARRLAEAVRERCGSTAVSAGAPRALLEVARGELQLHEWEEAERDATAALQLARTRRDGRTVLIAESLLDAIRSDRAAGMPRRGKAARAPAAEAEPEDALADELIRMLREMNPDAGAAEVQDDLETRIYSVTRTSSPEAETP